MDQKTFNPNSIKIIRKANKLTLEAFAKRLGPTFSRQLVYQWESGRQNPSVPSLLHIVNTFEVPFDIFFD